jgi:3-deoxy-7-phosphoheptulonate synthase
MALTVLYPSRRLYKLASREFIPENSCFPDGVTIGGDDVVIIAGPCSIESRSQLLEIAWAVREAGAHAIRGGAYKPRTSPYTFQGLGLEGLELLAEVRETVGLPVVTEVMTMEQIPLVVQYADVLQVGARNMQNFGLLLAVGASQHPVLLKRGMSYHRRAAHGGWYLLSEAAEGDFVRAGIRARNQHPPPPISTPFSAQIFDAPAVILDPGPARATGSMSAVAHAGIAARADGLIVGSAYASKKR